MVFSPVTYLHEAWFAATPPEHTLHLGQVVEVRGAEPTAADFQNLARTLIDRHDILRTTLRKGADGRAVYEVQPPGSITDVPVVDLSGYADPTAEMVSWYQTSIDVTRSPGGRFTVVLLESGRPALHLLIPHIFWDRGAVETFFRDASAWFAGTLTEPALQQAEYAAVQRAAEVPRESVAFWRDRFATEVPVLPCEDRGDEPFGWRLMPTLSAGHVAVLRRVTEETGTSFASAITALVATSQLSGFGGDAVIGRVYGNRRATDRTVTAAGVLADTLPVRFSLAGEPTFPELVTRVHRETALARRRHRLAGDLIRALVGQDRPWTVNCNYRGPYFERMAGEIDLAGGAGRAEVSLRFLDLSAQRFVTDSWFSACPGMLYNFTHHPDDTITGDIVAGRGHFGHLVEHARAFSEAADRLLADPRQPLRALAAL